MAAEVEGFVRLAKLSRTRPTGLASAARAAPGEAQQVEAAFEALAALTGGRGLSSLKATPEQAAHSWSRRPAR